MTLQTRSGPSFNDFQKPEMIKAFLVAGEFRLVVQFGVSEIDCLTEPSAVAPDAGVKLRNKQVAHRPPSFTGC